MVSGSNDVSLPSYSAMHRNRVYNTLNKKLLQVRIPWSGFPTSKADPASKARCRKVRGLLFVLLRQTIPQCWNICQVLILIYSSYIPLTLGLINFLYFRPAIDKDLISSKSSCDQVSTSLSAR